MKSPMIQPAPDARVLALKLFGPANMSRSVALILAGSLMIALAAQITVPMVPVPMTLQTLAVLLVGLGFGARLGALTVLAYLAEGALGLPVFANGGAGPTTLMGPTGGFLIGFLPAAWLTGWLAERGWTRNVLLTALAMAAGNLLIYVPGLLHLRLVTGGQWAQVWSWGAAPFLIGDAVKLAIGALLLPAGWALPGRGRGRL